MLVPRPLCFVFASHLVLTACADAQSFTPGNVAVLRIGDGIQTLTNAGNALFVDQYTPAGALVNTLPIPDTGAQALLASGTASSEGGLTRSMDRSELVLPGYNVSRGSITGSLSGQSSTAVPRAVATVDAFGNYSLAVSSTVLYNSNNIRSATSDGSNSFWTAGSPTGTYYVSPPQTPVEIQAAGGNTRFVKIIQGQLYFSTQAGTAGVYGFSGGGLPRTASSSVLLIATGANSQPAGFALSPGLTIAYVADQRSTAGGIQKWTNNGSAWSLAYTFSTGGGAYDVYADFSGSAPVLYATTAESSANRLISLTDLGPLSIVKVLANAGANRIFRGVSFVPNLGPLVVMQPQSQTVTNGSQVTFDVVAQSRVALTYQWTKDGAALPGATDSSLTLTGVSTADQGTYRVVVTNNYGSVTSVGAALTVNTVLTPPSITTQPSSQTVLLGGSATFNAAASGTQPLAYQWTFNGADLPAQTNSSLSILNASQADQGAYFLRVSNGAGTTNSQTVSLTVVAPNPSSVPYSAAASVYTQNFDSLPNPGTASVNADNPVKIGATTYGLANPFDFSFPILPNSVDPATGIGLGGLGLSNSMPGWYALGLVAPKFGASNGDQSTGGAISFGSTNNVGASTNRALGLLATSSTGPTAFGLKLVNQTISPLNQITLHFTGELWRQAAVAKTLSFSYWIDPTGTNVFGTNSTARLNGLDVSFPTLASATNPVPVDGTAPANQISVGVTNQAIATWNPSAALWLTWQMSDSAGKGQGLAIDDLVFSASAGQTVPPAVLSIGLSGGNALISWPSGLVGYQLQSNSDLGNGAGWGSVSQQVTVSNGFNVVTVPLAGTQFYRLKK